MAAEEVNCCRCVNFGNDGQFKLEASKSWPISWEGTIIT